MKTKAFILSLSFTLFSITGTWAQKSSKDDIKVKVDHAVDRLDEAFKLEKDKKSTIEDIFTGFYSEQQKLKNNIQRPASGLAQGLVKQDFQSVRKQNEALIAEREKRLKKELTEDQYKKWKGEIEPSLNKRK